MPLNLPDEQAPRRRGRPPLSLQERAARAEARQARRRAARKGGPMGRRPLSPEEREARAQARLAREAEARRSALPWRHYANPSDEEPSGANPYGWHPTVDAAITAACVGAWQAVLWREAGAEAMACDGCPLITRRWFVLGGGGVFCTACFGLRVREQRAAGDREAVIIAQRQADRRRIQLRRRRRQAAARACIEAS